MAPRNNVPAVGSLADIIVINWLHPLLSKVGFKRRKRTWNKKASGFTYVIDIQEAKSSTCGDERFTINIGVFIPQLYEIVWEKAAPKFVQEIDCAIRLRIGEIDSETVISAAKDIWWNLNENEVDKVGRSVSAIMHSSVLPFLGGITSIEATLAIANKIAGWRRNDPLHVIYRAALHAEIGDSLASKALIVQASANPAWRDRALLVQRFYKLNEIS